MPQRPKVKESVAAAREAADNAAELREEVRWTAAPDDPVRIERIENALAKLTAAMIPIRSLVGSLVWHPVPERTEMQIKEASVLVQYERHQLKKMLP